MSSPTFNSLCRLEEGGLLNGLIFREGLGDRERRAARRHLPVGTDLAGSVPTGIARHVVDFELLPERGVVNPAPRAMANTMRIGYHLLERTALNRNRNCPA